MSMHFLTFVFHFITYWPLLWKNYLQIIKLLVFPSRTFRKQLTSCCITLSCPQIYIPYLLFCVSSHIGHPCEEIAIKLSDNQDFLQEPLGSSWEAVAACFNANENALVTFRFAFHYISATPVEKLSSNCQTTRISFKSLQEEVDELLQHASIPTSMHFSLFVLHFITYRVLQQRNCLQIVRQSELPSRAFRKQLTSCCSMLPCTQEWISHLLFWTSLHIGNSCWEIIFKLSNNQDFLQEPSGSSWQAFAACFHTHESAFLTF